VSEFVGDCPERGHLIWLPLDPTRGHEQAGRRPALVLSPSSYNGRTGLAVICPVTSRSKGYPFEVALPTGLTVSGVVLADQVRSIDWVARGVSFAEVAPPEVLEQVIRRLCQLIGSADSSLGISPPSG
jgi:mRNA interferase MazF